MKTTQDAVLSALEGAQRFLDTNKAVLTSTVDFTAARKRLDDVVAGFTTHAFDQDASNRNAKGETEKQRQMRVTLRAEQMAPIAEIGASSVRCRSSRRSRCRHARRRGERSSHRPMPWRMRP